MEGHGLRRLVDGVRSKKGKAPLHDGLIFFWCSGLTIVGGEFGKIRTDDDVRIPAVSIKDPLSLWIGTIKIGFFAVLIKRDGNERPGSHEVFGCRLSKSWRDKTSTEPGKGY